MGNVAGFLPSRNGLHYPNSWPSVPDLKIHTPLGDVGIGNASNGLCGGMAFVVRDLFEARQMPPASHQNPLPDSPAFNFIVSRLFDSFNLPGGVAQYLEWMNLPRHDTMLGPHGLSWRTINETMPRIRSTIDGGHPCPIGMVCIHSANPMDLGQNHQVLVWGYQDNGNTTTLRLYDSNWPDRDDVTITFDHANPTHTTDFNYSTGDHTVLGFFTADYGPHDPTPLFEDGHTPPAGWQSPAEWATIGGGVDLLFKPFPDADAVRMDAYYATNPADVATVGWRHLGQAQRAPSGAWCLHWDTTQIADQGNEGWGTVNIVAVSSKSGQDMAPSLYRHVKVLNHRPAVGFITPSGRAPDGGDPQVSGALAIKVFAPGADRVDFSAYYATDPFDNHTVAWRPIGQGAKQADGTFTLSWDTTKLPDQGNAGWGTVNIAATPYYGGTAAAPEHRFYERVRVFNYGGFIAPVAPAGQSIPIVTGDVHLHVRAGGADRIDFSAYYATDPHDAHTVAWHSVGQGARQSDGTFLTVWNTRPVPDQGNAGWGTVNVCATPYYGGKAATPDHRFYRLIQIKNH